MAKRLKQQKSAITGLLSLQTIGTVAVPATLEEVPEENEIKSESPELEIFGTDDWKSVEDAVKNIFRGEFLLSENGILYNLHQNVKNILRSRTGTFLCDCYKDWLTKELNIKAQQFWNLTDMQILHRLEEIWTHFYTDTLPLLEAIFYLLKPKGRLSIRGTTLMAFRDVIFFSETVEGVFRAEPEYLTLEIKRMILILYSVNDCYPPSKNKLRLESIAASTCPSFMGYFGLYENGELILPSNEPATVAKRRPSADVGPRRISRPFSVQPQQMETLSQLFKNAVKHNKPKGEHNRGRFQKHLKNNTEKIHLNI